MRNLVRKESDMKDWIKKKKWLLLYYLLIFVVDLTMTLSMGYDANSSGIWIVTLCMIGIFICGYSEGIRMNNMYPLKKEGE